MAGQVPLRVTQREIMGRIVWGQENACPCPLGTHSEIHGTDTELKGRSLTVWPPPPSILRNSHTATSDLCQQSEGKLYQHAP